MNTQNPTTGRTRGGFTLIEVMIAMAISMIMIGLVFETFLHQNKMYLVQEQVTEMQNEARAILDLLALEVQMARYGTPSENLTPVAGCPTCQYWFVGSPDMVTNPRIIPGATAAAPDQFKFLRVENRLTQLTVAVAKGNTTMTVADGSVLDTVNDVFVINNFSIGKITAGLPTPPGPATLTVDMLLFNKKTPAFNFSYPVNAEVGATEVILYRVNGQALERVDEDGATILSDSIDDFQVATVSTIPSGANDTVGTRLDTYRFTVTVRAAKPDAKYVHPTKGDHYRRATFTQDVTVRNLGIESYQFLF